MRTEDCHEDRGAAGGDRVLVAVQRCTVSIRGTRLMTGSIREHCAGRSASIPRGRSAPGGGGGGSVHTAQCALSLC